MNRVNIKRIKNLATMAAVSILLGVQPPGASGQTVGQSTEELERLIQAQQQQLEAQQVQLDRQRKLLEELQRQIQEQSLPTATNAASPLPVGPTTVKSPMPDSDPHPVTGPPEMYQQGKHDWQHPTASQFQRGDHSKTVKIPGTTTEIGIHGFVELQTFYDNRAIENNEFFPSLIPVDGAPSQTWFNPNFSRLELSSATPVEWGRVNTFFEVDFNQDTTSRTAELRLRHAYGEVGHAGWKTALLVGQSWSSSVDLKAVPETLDYAGPVGSFSQRRPLLRLTRPFGGRLTTELSIESPGSATYEGASPMTRWPDASLAGTWAFKGDYLKHLRAGVVIRDLRADGPTGATDSALGWAIYGSSKIGLPFLGTRDNLRFSANYGEGFGSLVADGPVDAAFNNLSLELETVALFNVQGGLQHWWMDKLRSNLVGGYLKTDTPGCVSSDALGHAVYLAANLIWTPLKNLSFGVEYLWGRRENAGAESGDSSRFLFSSKFQF